MINLVGVGNTGCNIIEILSQYPQYTVHKIDEGINVTKQTSPEIYEKKCPSFKKMFAKSKGEFYIFLSASGNISGILLRLLEQLKSNPLNVIAITSDPKLLSVTGKLQQNLVTGIMKEYARSGLIQNFYCLDNSLLEEMIGDCPIDKYYDSLNQFICYLFHSYMCMENTKPIMETKQEELEISRICTFGLLDKQNNKKVFYPINNPTQERYYYSFSKEDLSKNSKILQNIKNNLTEEENIKKSFAVFESEETDQYVLIKQKTHILI